MTCVTPPFSHAVYAEADRLAPRRARGADGTCPSLAHHLKNPTSDHEPSGPNHYSHAIDITQSTPGSPDFAVGDSVLDAHHFGFLIGARMIAGVERRVKYLVSSDGRDDLILDLAVSPRWRLLGTRDHANHLHTSFFSTAELSTAPFFVLVPHPEVLAMSAQAIVPGAHAQSKGPWAGLFPKVAFVPQAGGTWDAVGLHGARITEPANALNVHGATEFNGMSVFHLGRPPQPIVNAEGANSGGPVVVGETSGFLDYAINVVADYV